MKRKVPRFRRKVQGVPGDCMLPGLGLTSADKTMLVKNVSKIIRSGLIQYEKQEVKFQIWSNIGISKLKTEEIAF